MVSEKSKALVFFVLSISFALLAFATGLAGLTTSSWKIVSSTHIGFFRTCDVRYGNCYSTPSDDLLMTVRNILIAMLVVDYIGIITVNISLSLRPVLLRKVSVIPFTLSGVIGVTGLAIFISSTINRPRVTLGLSFTIASVCVWLPFLAAIFTYLSGVYFARAQESKNGKIEDLNRSSVVKQVKNSHSKLVKLPELL